MKKEEVIRRFCLLATEVATQAFKDQYAHDCFCPDAKLHLDSFIFDEEILRYIEDAVTTKLHNNKDFVQSA